MVRVMSGLLVVGAVGAAGEQQAALGAHGAHGAVDHLHEQLVAVGLRADGAQAVDEHAHAVGVALRVAGRGDWKLGLWAAFGAFCLVAGSVWPLPEIAHGWTGEDRVRNLSTAYGTFNNNYLYLIFGMLTAYRYTSRRFPRPPGM